ncbi:hypothetical protein FRAHR75_2880001 [Frankia sp. Hr75.2]|nr:hypothetical protein FRAHR75_2880001 [Frankia sp. Hr75.2]
MPETIETGELLEAPAQAQPTLVGGNR